MRAGGRRELIIPPDLAYGHNSYELIGPDETLVYVVDLIGVQDPSGAPVAADARSSRRAIRSSD